MRRHSLKPILLVLLLGMTNVRGIELKPDGYHVLEGNSIQQALDMAAKNPTNKAVKVHAGTYRPDSKRLALIWLNRAHDGVRLEAVGDVTLTAANATLSDPKAPSHPAVVNHIVYFGDGIGTNTVFKGFRLTGANNFVIKENSAQIEPDNTIPKGLFFFSDGGAIKVFGRSYPLITDIEVVDNYSSPCAAGISVQHEGHRTNSVIIQNCVFRNNRAQVTGAAIDLLEGSTAKVINCLFVGNFSNLGEDYISKQSSQPPFTNSGVVTVFPDSRVWMEDCTFVDNRNGVDDMGTESIYLNCIFWNNEANTGLKGGKRFALDVQTGNRVIGCFISGAMPNPYNGPNQKDNSWSPPPPRFDAIFAPQAPEYSKVGYRPIAKSPKRQSEKQVNPSAR